MEQTYSSWLSRWLPRPLATLGLLLAMVGTTQAQNPVVSFAAVVTYGTGTSSPHSIAVADVNGDGKPDLLTANSVYSTVGVLLGNGNGTFQAAATYGTGTDSNPYNITVADVNGDGKPDLLTASPSDNRVEVLLGNGSGTFQNPTRYGTGTSSNPVDIAVADVNGDGKPDLLTANVGSSTASVLLGSGTGTFQNPTTYGTGTSSNPQSIAVADINGDGKPDLLTANVGSSTAGVLLNTTVYAPTLTSLTPTSGPVGSSVTLTGTNLTGATAVRFNGTAATTFAVVNATALTATVPAGATSGNVTVTTPGGTSNGVAFTVTTAPTVTTAAATSLTSISAVLGGNVTADGTDVVVERGVVYSSTNTSPTLGGPGVIQDANGAGTGSYSKTIADLTPGTTYTVRAYAINRAGTSYGAALTFTTGASSRVVAITRADSNPTNAASVRYTVTFSAPITGLSASNFSLLTTGVTSAAPASVSGAGTTYTVTVVTGSGSGTLLLYLNNGFGVPTLTGPFLFYGQTYTLDKTAPTVTITSPTAPNGGNTVSTPLNFVITFSEAVTGFDIGDIENNFTNVASSTFTPISATVYTLSVMPAHRGAVTLTVPANVATDAAGNGNVAATPYTILQGVPTAAPVLTAPATNSFTSALPTYAGTAPAGSTVAVYVDGTSLGSTTATGGTFSLTQPTALTEGLHSVYATAQAPGQLVSAASSVTFQVDATPPTVTSLTTTAGSSTSTSPIPFSVTFSEPVTGLAASGIQVLNGRLSSGPTGSGSGPYTFRVTPTGSSAVSVMVVAGAVQDAVGNQNSASSSLSVSYAPPMAGAIRVLYQTGDLGQPTDNQLRPFLQLVNAGPTAVPYQSLTVRYWLTVENYAGQLVTPIDYAKLGTSFVSARYVPLPTPRQGAYGYIEYSFAAGAGSLAPGTDSGPIYGKAYQPNYTAFDETDDWSYQTSSSFSSNAHLTVYQNGTLLSGTEPPVVAASPSLKVYAGNQDTSPTTSYLSVQLQVGNVGNVPVNYADLKVRYWFTPDGTQPLVYQVDYAPLGSQNVSLRTGQKGTQTYAELSFAGALGTFSPLSNTGPIQFKIRKDNYGAFTQANDYSFSGSSALGEQPRITAYLNGQLVFGTEPTGAAASALRSGQAASATTSQSALVTASQSALAMQLTGSPNPFTDQLRLTFALPYAQAYTLAVYDGLGRLVQQLAAGQAAAGQLQQVEVPTQTYAAGFYLVRLTTATGEQHLKLLKH